MSPQRMRVIRALVYDGPRDWVEHTLQNSRVQGQIVYGNSKITETILNRCVYEAGKEDETQG